MRSLAPLDPLPLSLTFWGLFSCTEIRQAPAQLHFEAHPACPGFPAPQHLCLTGCEPLAAAWENPMARAALGPQGCLDVEILGFPRLLKDHLFFIQTLHRARSSASGEKPYLLHPQCGSSN